MSGHELGLYRVYSDGIDRDMKRSSWLNWAVQDPAGKVPKRPGDPETNAKSNDPATWGSFEEVLRNAERCDLGVGFPLAQATPFTALDIDVPDEGEWVPPFNLGGAVVERSPSGNFRVFLRDVEVPEWWTNQSDPGKNAREVKVFDDSGYVTVTGDVIDGHGPPIGETSQAAFETWLKDARRAFHDEDDPEPWREKDSSVRLGDAQHDNGRGESGDQLDEDDIRDALRYIDPDVSYDTWRNIGFALDDHFPSSTALALFKEWSRRGDKWDSDAGSKAERIINDAKPDGGRTVATVIHHAQSGGWTKPTRTRLRSSSEGAESDKENSLPVPDEFLARDGEYGQMKTRGSGDDVRQVWDRWTSFEIEVIEFRTDANAAPTDSSTEATLRIHPADDGEASYDVTAEMAVFNEVRTFKNSVTVGRTTTFEAGMSELNRIRRFVGKQDAPQRTGVSQIGLYGLDSGERAEWVTPDGVLTADGWSENPAHVFGGRDTETARGWSLDPEDGDEFDCEDVRDAIRLVPQTRLSDRFLPVLGWFYAAPLRPYIMRWEEEFNPLNVLGDTGSGKTTTLQTLSRMFGGPDGLLSASGTPFATMSAFAASNAMPIVFDEYKPADMADHRVDQFNEYYRKSTRGGVETRGRRDMGTDRFPLRAPVAVAGEQALRGPAEQRRTILAEFSKRAAERYSTTREAFARLAGLSYKREDGKVKHFEGVPLRDHALGYYRFILGLSESDLQEGWRKAGQRVRRVLARMGNGAADNVRDAEFRALQTVGFGIGIYRAFADEHGVDATSDPMSVTDEALEAALRRLVTRGDESTKRRQQSSHVDGLLGLIARAAAAEYIEDGEHYQFVNEGKPDELLCVRLNETFDNVRRYARDHDLRGEDLFDMAEDYRSRLQDAAETEDSMVVDTARQVRGINRTVAFHVGQAMETVEGFDRDMFGERKPNKYVGFGVEADRMTGANIAADGGNGGSTGVTVYDPPPNDAEGVKANRERVVITLREMYDRSGEAIDYESLLTRANEQFDLSRAVASDALTDAERRGLIEDTAEGGGKYRPL